MKKLLIMMTLLVSALSPVYSGGIATVELHAHAVDEFGNFLAGDESIFDAGELIQFENSRGSVLQTDGFSIKNLQTGQNIGCVQLFTPEDGPDACKMVFWDIVNNKKTDESCDDVNITRSFSEPGQYEVSLRSHGFGTCSMVVDNKTITILDIPVGPPPTPQLVDNFAWLIPIVSLILN